MSITSKQIVVFDEDTDLFELITQQYLKKHQVLLKPLTAIEEVKDFLNDFIIIRDSRNEIINFFAREDLLLKSFKENLLFILRDSIDNFNFIYEPIRIEELFVLITKFLHKISQSSMLMLKPEINYDFKNQKIYLKEEKILLSEKENLILKYLFDAKEEVTKDQLLRDIWGYKAGVNTHTVETHIYRIRAKIKNDIIITTKEGNYKLPL